jgi:hypothetical protein
MSPCFLSRRFAIAIAACHERQQSTARSGHSASEWQEGLISLMPAHSMPEQQVNLPLRRTGTRQQSFALIWIC